MAGPSDPSDLFLDYFEEEFETKWCWKREATGEASQVFDSEEAALEAWRADQLYFEAMPEG
jgi:hypothetical protein